MFIKSLLMNEAMRCIIYDILVIYVVVDVVNRSTGNHMDCRFKSQLTADFQGWVVVHNTAINLSGGNFH